MQEPRTARGRATRRNIVETAARLMYARGVAAVGLDDVLVASGTGKSQLYHYFNGRAELVAAVVEHQLETVLGDQRRFAVGTPEGLRAWFDSLVAGQVERGCRGCPLGSLAAQLAGEGEDARLAAARAFARWEDDLADAMSPADRAASARKQARVVLAAIQGGYLLSSIAHDVGPMRQALDAAHASVRSAQ